ncbi:M15 family metallopeptidase [Sphingomonas sp. ACRSK]|uniref:M15 family metallopeptidase n=1 Tax=Sphingomonas sp. ACRSK TaxID=2918213 RepID=UPI001EF57BA9|nr:M15 family metallopeptidase [Sphingomonas sp. ACRSK]MCG7348920.1 M15 family metallopeptidase [Sphingomonas sp. ACRSK]
MAIVLGSRSLSRLEGVHPDLVRVVKRAAAMAARELDFTVLEGVRSAEQCYINYGKGRTAAQCRAAGVPDRFAAPGAAKVTWLKNPLNSKHCKQRDGLGHAVDLAPYPIDWNDLHRFDAMAKLVLEAAKIEKVAIRWGADWNSNGKPREKGETDSPHFELAR